MVNARGGTVHLQLHGMRFQLIHTRRPNNLERALRLKNNAARGGVFEHGRPVDGTSIARAPR